MATDSNAGLRIAGIGGGLLAVVGGAAGLMIRRRVASVKSTERSDLDAATEPPADISHASFASADGGKIHYVDTDPESQQRPTVVLLHGITNQWWIWSAVMRDLSPEFRVISWDMRGFGASRPGTRGVDLGAAADDLRIKLEVERLGGH